MLADCLCFYAESVQMGTGAGRLVGTVSLKGRLVGSCRLGGYLSPLYKYTGWVNTWEKKKKKKDTTISANGHCCHKV